MKNNISPIQYSIYRALLGAYILLHSVFLMPYVVDLYGSSGMVYSARLNPTYILFPINLLIWFDSELFLKFFISTVIFLAALLIIGYKRRVVAAFLFYAWLCLFNRNNLTLTPGMAFVGWSLLVMVFIPEGEPYSVSGKRNSEWQMPQVVFAGAWFIMSLSYTLSGVDKLLSVSWLDGTAIHKLLGNPLTRETTFVEIFRSQSFVLHKIITYFILFAELLFFPLALFDKLKPVIWSIMVLIHLGILILMNISDLTLCMLLIHVFTFNVFWIRKRPHAKEIKSQKNVQYI